MATILESVAEERQRFTNSGGNWLRRFPALGEREASGVRASAEIEVCGAEGVE